MADISNLVLPAMVMDDFSPVGNLLTTGFLMILQCVKRRERKESVVELLFLGNDTVHEIIMLKIIKIYRSEATHILNGIKNSSKTT